MKPIIFRITGMSYEVHKTLTKNKSKDQPYCDLSFSADGDLLGTSQKNGVISGEYSRSSSLCCPMWNSVNGNRNDTPHFTGGT